MRGRVGRHGDCGREQEAISVSGRNEKEKKGDQPGQGDSGQGGHGKGAGEGRDGQAQKAHDGALADGVAEASRALSEAVAAVLNASRGIHQRVQALLS